MIHEGPLTWKVNKDKQIGQCLIWGHIRIIIGLYFLKLVFSFHVFLSVEFLLFYKWLAYQEVQNMSKSNHVDNKLFLMDDVLSEINKVLSF